MRQKARFSSLMSERRKLAHQKGSRLLALIRQRSQEHVSQSFRVAHVSGASDLGVEDPNPPHPQRNSQVLGPSADTLGSEHIDGTRPAVRRKRLSEDGENGLALMYSASVWRLMLRAMMDISAHPLSLADRPLAAIWVTRSRMRRRDHFPSLVPLADLGRTPQC